MHIIATVLLWTTYIISLFFTIFWLIVFLDDLSFKTKKEKKLSYFPFVSVIVPAYNEEKCIEQTLNSIIGLNYPKSKYEIVIVNDGSKDNTIKNCNSVIKKNPDYNITLIDQKNSGKAAALNNALKIIKGKYFACLDADSCVQKDTLMKMLKLYEKEKDSDLTIVTPAMKVSHPKNLIQKFQRLEYLVALFIARLMSKLDCLYVAPGPFSLYKTSKIRSIGGFDEHNLTEDMEIAYRVQCNNFKIKHCRGAEVFTNAPNNISSLYKQRNRWFKGGMFNALKYKKLLLNKNYGDFGLLQMSINILAFALSASALSFFVYFMIRPVVKSISNLFIVDFEIWPYLTSLFDFHFNILSINVSVSFIVMLMLTLGFSILYLSHKNANEKINRYGVIHIAPFFLVYYLLISIMMVAAVIELALGKKQKW